MRRVYISYLRRYFPHEVVMIPFISRIDKIDRILLVVRFVFLWISSRDEWRRGGIVFSKVSSSFVSL